MCLTGVVAQAAVKHAAVAARCRRRDMVLKTNVCRVVHVCVQNRFYLLAV